MKLTLGTKIAATLGVVSLTALAAWTLIGAAVHQLSAERASIANTLLPLKVQVANVHRTAAVLTRKAASASSAEIPADTRAALAELDAALFRSGEILESIRDSEQYASVAALDSLGTWQNEHTALLRGVGALESGPLNVLAENSAAGLVTIEDMIMTRLGSVSVQEQRVWTAPYAGAGVMGLTSLLAGWLLVRSINVRVRKMVRMADQIAKGNLFIIEERDAANDEISRLAESLRNINDRTREFATELGTRGVNVAAAGAMIADTTNRLSGMLFEQQNRLQIVSSAMDEVNSCAQDVSESVVHMSTEAQKARDDAKAGTEALTLVTGGVAETSHQIADAADRVKKLQEHTESIKSLLASIVDIADQTNLLALNAAIEAARAGTHGRGFAVVADEVRKLAERTTSITSEISASISSISNAMDSTVQTINEGVSRSHASADATRSASDRLNQIIGAFDHVATLTEALRTKSVAQASAINSIRDEITEATQACTLSTNDGDQSMLAAAEVSGQSEKILEFVKRYKITRREFDRFVIPGLDSNLGTVADLSASGARIVLGRRELPALGSEIEFVISDQSGRTAAVRGCVQWTKRVSRLGTVAGYRFTQIPAESQQVLDEWLHEALMKVTPAADASPSDSSDPAPENQAAIAA